MSDDFIYIDEYSKLMKYCDQLRGVTWLAVDTEFEREKTYYPELCLIQMTDGQQAAVIDPLAIDDLTPLMDLFYDPSIIKVFHSARQDLEIFYNLRGSVPFPLFDTQLAAPLLGYQEQAGYANLVKAIVGVELSKSHTRTDWKRRPLSKGQLRYAVDDVIYLAEIYQKMLEQLTILNRLDWLDSDFDEMTKIEIYEPHTDQIWRRIRGANRLKGKKLSVLQALAKWREETARNENRPRNWLLRDDAIIDMAHQLPDNKDALYAIKGLHERVAKKYGGVLLKIIKDAQNIEPQPLTERVKDRALTTDQEALVDAMMAIVRLRAGENNLNPTILAPRKEIERLVQNKVSIINTSWRDRMIGKELNAFINGELTFKVINNQIQLIPV